VLFVLSPTIKALWERLRLEPLLRGFVLVGGSALTLHIHHRESEDLDFCYPSERLPESQIKALLQQLGNQGLLWTRNDSASVFDEFEIAGDHLDHYQQNFLLEGRSQITLFTLPYDSHIGN
jgi:Nucleotidyl transferase AbiEii toxin, Type IV TA system